MSVFAVLNCAHHVLMYAYFGGVAASWKRPVLPWTGVLQLVVGIWVEVGLLREELGGMSGVLFGAVFAGVES